MLEPGPGDDGGVEAHPGHGGERHPVGDGQVDHPVDAAGVERARSAACGCPGTRSVLASRLAVPWGTIAERYPGPGQPLGAAAHGPVAADGDHQVDPVERRPAGRRDPGLGLLGDQELGSPAVPGGGLPAQRQQVAAATNQRAIDHKRDTRHNVTEATLRRLHLSWRAVASTGGYFRCQW